MKSDIDIGIARIPIAAALEMFVLHYVLHVLPFSDGYMIIGEFLVLLFFTALCTFGFYGEMDSKNPKQFDRN